MKQIINKTKEELLKEIVLLKKLIRTLFGIFLTIILVFPWGAVFLGAKFSIWVGLVSVIFSIILIKILKNKKII